MTRSPVLRNSLVWIIAACLSCASWAQALPGTAAAPATTVPPLITTGEMQQAERSVSHRRLLEALSREEIVAGLQARGVSAEAARERVRSLTDDEAAQVAATMDRAPAGGDVVGALLTIFIVLLITDILGFTKVFPFTRSIR
jgi:hypothetical protein